MTWGILVSDRQNFAELGLEDQLPEHKVSISKVENALNDYYELLSRSHSLFQGFTDNESLVDELLRNRFKMIDKLSALPTSDIGEVARKIEVWLAESSPQNGGMEPMRHEDKLILSALKDLIKMQN